MDLLAEMRQRDPKTVKPWIPPSPVFWDTLAPTATNALRHPEKAPLRQTSGKTDILHCSILAACLLSPLPQQANLPHAVSVLRDPIAPLMEPFADLAQTAAKVFANPCSLLDKTRLHSACPLDLTSCTDWARGLREARVWHRTIDVDGDEVAIHERVELANRFARLRRFKRFTDDARRWKNQGPARRPDRGSLSGHYATLLRDTVHHAPRTIRSTSPTGRMPAWYPWKMANSTSTITSTMCRSSSATCRPSMATAT